MPIWPWLYRARQPAGSTKQPGTPTTPYNAAYCRLIPLPVRLRKLITVDAPGMELGSTGGSQRKTTKDLLDEAGSVNARFAEQKEETRWRAMPTETTSERSGP